MAPYSRYVGAKYTSFLPIPVLTTQINPCFIRIAFILATFLCLGFSSSADAQTTWAETPGLLTADYVAEAYRGTVYQDPIAVRAGQQTIYFDAGVTAFIRMEVSIDGGSWQRIYDGSATYQNIAWTGVPPHAGRVQRQASLLPD